MPSSWTSRGSLALATFGSLFSLLRALPTAHAAPTAPAAPTALAAPAAPTAMPAPPPLPTDSWIASGTGAWRLPTAGEHLAFLDARHLVVIPYSTDLTHRPLLVDVTTGAVSPLTPIISQDAVILNLVRVGPRVLAFGLEDDAPSAWQLSLQSSPSGPALVATSLDPAAGPTGRAPEYPGVIVSPDERWLIWCHSNGPATLRDPATLRVLRNLDVASCKRPGFPSLDRVVLGDEEVELATGELRPVSGELRQLAGPRRRVLEVQGDYRQLAVVRDGKRVTQQAFEFDDDVRWTPDGVAISLTRNALTLRPAADGTSRTMRPRLRYGFRRTYAISSTHAAILDGPSLELVDLTTGESKLPDGNLAAVSALVPFGGGVASAADRLRFWRSAAKGIGQLVTEEDADVSALRATPTRLVAIDGWQQVWTWDPVTNLRRAVGGVDAIVDAFLTTSGEDIWFGTQYTLEHSQNGQPARTQARFRIGLTPLAYHPRGLFALGEDPDVLHLADLASGRARRWNLAKYCALVPDGLFANRMVLRGLSELHVVDLDSGSAFTYELAMATSPELAVASTGDLAIATEDHLVLWRPGDDSARQLKMPLPEGDVIKALRFSADGKELALGTSNGGVFHDSVAGLRARGQQVPVEKSTRTCLDGEAKPETFAQLGLIVMDQKSVGVGAPAARSSSAFKKPPNKTESTDR